MVAEDIHGVLLARAGGLLMKHLHAWAVQEQGTVMEAVKSLLEDRDRHSYQPVTAPWHLEALKERTETGGMCRFNHVTRPRRDKGLLRKKGLGGGCGGDSVLITGGRGPIGPNRASTVRGVASGRG